MKATGVNSAFSFFFTLFVFVFVQGLYQCQDDSFIDRVKESDQIEKTVFHYFEKRATSPNNDHGFNALGGQEERSHSPKSNLQNIMRQLAEVEINPKKYRLPEIEHDPYKMKNLESRIRRYGDRPPLTHQQWNNVANFPHGPRLPEGGRSTSGGETIHVVINPNGKPQPIQAHIKGADGKVRRVTTPIIQPSSPRKNGLHKRGFGERALLKFEKRASHSGNDKGFQQLKPTKKNGSGSFSSPTSIKASTEIPGYFTGTPIQPPSPKSSNSNPSIAGYYVGPPANQLSPKSANTSPERKGYHVGKPVNPLPTTIVGLNGEQYHSGPPARPSSPKK